MSGLVYILSDPRDQRIRYVGKTLTTLNNRLSAHLSPTHLSRRTHNAAWLRSLVKEGLRPIAEVVERCPEEDLADAERFWKVQFEFLGFTLTNLTDGGEGRPGYKMSEVTKKKISAANSGRRWTSEQRARHSLAQRGTKKPRSFHGLAQA